MQHYNPVSLHPEMRKYTIFIDGISKAFAATGVRVGWAFGPECCACKNESIFKSYWCMGTDGRTKSNSKISYCKKNYYNNILMSLKLHLELRLNKIYDGLIALKNEGFNVDAITPQAAIYLTVKFDLVGKKTCRYRIKIAGRCNRIFVE